MCSQQDAFSGVNSYICEFGVEYCAKMELWNPAVGSKGKQSDNLNNFLFELNSARKTKIFILAL